MSALETALAYHAQGFTVIPLIEGVKAPSIPRWTREGLSEPQTEARVRKLFANHDGNIGVLTGAPSRLLVVDIDVKNGRPGLASLAAWEAKHGPLPHTRTHQTPSGGMHKLLRTPAGFRFATSHIMGQGIDVMGTGGQIVAPPSELVGTVGANGAPQVPGPYVVTDEAPIADCPPALLAQLEAAREHGSVAPKEWAPVTADDPTYAERIDLQRQGFATESLYLEGESSKGVVRYVMMFQRLGPGLSLDFETTTKVYAEIYDPRLPEENRWLPDCREELLQTIARAYVRPMSTGYAVDAFWKERQVMKEIRGGVAARNSGEATAPGRALIQVDTDLARVVAEAAHALGNDPALFTRAGDLVRIVRIDASRADDAHREGTPQIRTLPAATLKVALTRAAHWVGNRLDPKTKEWKQVETTPGDDVVAAVSQMAEWPRVPRLVGITESPVMRPDGTILQARGYDPSTGFYFDARGVAFPSVPESPTQAQAYAALCELYEPFADFPHASGPAGMVPVAAVLTLLGRPAISGNVPAFLFEANTRGSGKTLEGDAVATIGTGRPASKVTFPRTDEEQEKILGGYARRGAVLFSFDNISVDNPFGGAPLDKVLTAGGAVDLRILGKTEMLTFDWRAVILGTGNNIAFRGDTTRRVLVCRLESPLENPEDREDFAHPELLDWITRERARLVVAGLTILRAYVAAGRPNVGTKLWGSFESWSRLIPRAIVWAAGSAEMDPQLARPTFDESAEPEKTLLERLLNAFPSGAWRVRELLEGRDGEPFASPQLRAVVEEIAPPTERNRADLLGKALRAWKGRVVGGRRLATRKSGGGLMSWSVDRV